ncbi:hypothetical protein JXA56_03375 [Candidatus Micrarchaeota archaeon]|nr:hypothetical protein [Candidatus Micrarchaeota archaeon]
MDRIMTEIFLEKPNFKEVSKVSRILGEHGIKAIILPPEDRNINTHLVVEQSDLAEARKLLGEMGAVYVEKEVILIRLENKPGTMAMAATKIAEKGINLTYAFSVTMNDKYSLILLGSDDNKEAIKALTS